MTKKNSSRGIALITVTMTVIFALIVDLAALSRALGNFHLVQHTQQQLQAFYWAEGGVDGATKALIADLQDGLWSLQSFGDSTFTTVPYAVTITYIGNAGGTQVLQDPLFKLTAQGTTGPTSAHLVTLSQVVQVSFPWRYAMYAVPTTQVTDHWSQIENCSQVYGVDPSASPYVTIPLDTKLADANTNFADRRNPLAAFRIAGKPPGSGSEAPVGDAPQITGDVLTLDDPTTRVQLSGGATVSGDITTLPIPESLPDPVIPPSCAYLGDWTFDATYYDDIRRGFPACVVVDNLIVPPNVNVILNNATTIHVTNSVVLQPGSSLEAYANGTDPSPVTRAINLLIIGARNDPSNPEQVIIEGDPDGRTMLKAGMLMPAGEIHLNDSTDPRFANASATFQGGAAAMRFFVGSNANDKQCGIVEHDLKLYGGFSANPVGWMQCDTLGLCP